MYMYVYHVCHTTTNQILISWFPQIRRVECPKTGNLGAPKRILTLAPQCLPGTWSRQLRPRSYQNCIMEDKFSTKQQTKPKEPDMAFRHIWDILFTNPPRFWSDTLWCVLLLTLCPKSGVGLYMRGSYSHYCQSRSTTLIIFLIIVYCQSLQLPPSPRSGRPI